MITPEEKDAAIKRLGATLTPALNEYERRHPTPKLKVWGVDAHLHGVNGQRRAIVAARSKVAAAKAMGLSAYFFNGYAADTGNAEEVATAMSKPGVVFHRLLDDRGAEWEELR